MSDNKDSNNLFIERRPDGSYVVLKANAERASAVAATQEEAIERAKELNPNAAIHVERVRDTDTGSPNQWRKP